MLVPLERRHTYEDTRAFAAAIARQIADAHPDLATTEWSKASRRGVLIDARQNAKGKSIASVYSVRPIPGAPVSTPLRWNEVNQKLDPASYTMDAVLRRVGRHGDLYEGVLKTRQRLGPGSAPSPTPALVVVAYASGFQPPESGSPTRTPKRSTSSGTLSSLSWRP